MAETLELQREQRRLQALHEHAVLDTAPDPDFDALTRLCSQVLQMPVALISLVDADRSWFKSRHGTDLREAPRLGGFCTEAIHQGQMLVVEDARLDPRFALQAWMTHGAEPWRFYAGVPLTTEDGLALGTLCVLDREPRRLDTAGRQLLQALAQQATALLKARRQTQTLRETLRTLQAERDQQAELQQALQREQAFNQDLITHAPVGIGLYDLQGHCLAANPALGRHVGGAVEQLLRQNIFQIEALAASGLLETLKQSLASGQAGRGVLQRRSSFGRDVWLALSFIALGHGDQRQLMVISQDLSELRQAESKWLDAQAGYRMLFVNSMDGVLQTLPNGQVLTANPAACQALGMSEPEICVSPRERLLDIEDPRLAALLGIRDRHGHAVGRLRMRRSDGQCFEAEVSSALFTDAQGRALASVVFRDITTRLDAERRLHDSVRLLDNLAQRVPGAIFQYRRWPDGRACFPFASEGMQAIYECSPEALREDAVHARSRIHPEDAEAMQASIEASANSLQLWHLEFRVCLPLQGERWRLGSAQPERLADGSVLWHGFVTDITERKQAEAQTHQLAYYDALTRLPNRRLLLSQIEQALAASRRQQQMGALLFIDLDHFKHINDAMGHSVGDELLQQVARQLRAVTRDTDTVARLGGDEFVVLLTELGPTPELGAAQALRAADTLRQALQISHEIGGRQYGVSCSIGVSLFPHEGQAVDDLLREADTAMYSAKAAGRDRIACFEPAMHAEVQDRLDLEHDLQSALERGELAVHVQPQYDGLGQAQGAELLLRWQHPVRGNVSPAQFIPVAEESGLILPLGEQVLRQACLALAEMQRAGRLLPLSVNVSPQQFRQADFTSRLRALLDDTGAPASALILEVTENLLIEDWQATLARMEHLVQWGVRFSIDDFGTGYSSLAYLRRLPLYELKIDRSFVSDTPHDPDGTAIVEAILSMAKLLKLRVVAEGVETREQSRYLTAHGCNCQQGFLFARPRPLNQWLAEWLAG